MKPRSDPPLVDGGAAPGGVAGRGPAPGSPGRRLAPWIAVALVLLAGVVLAFRYGTRVTPLLDGIR